MRTAALLLLISGIAVAQDAPPSQQAPDSMMATIRAHGSPETPITIAIRGKLFHGFGVISRPGYLRLEGNGGTARGIIWADLSRDEGSLTFSSPREGPELEIEVQPRSGGRVPVLQAHGHVVTVARMSSGVLVVRTGH